MKQIATHLMKKHKPLTMVVLIAGLTMGNESCEKTKERQLKMEAEVGYFKAQTIKLPTGEVIDFPYVVNSLFYRQVMESDYFTLALSSAPVSSNVSSSTTRLTNVNSKGVEQVSTRLPLGLTSYDKATLAQFGFKDHAAGEPGMGVVSKGTADDDAATPACVYETPLARLGGEVISYAATWGVGVGIGYGTGGGALPSTGGIGGSVNFTNSDLDLGMRWDSPLYNNPLVVADGLSSQEKIDLSINFVPGVPVGMSFFFQEAIAKTIKDAMNSGIEALVTKYSMGKTWGNSWESRVLFEPELVDNDTYVAFRGGTYANIQVGDTFHVQNMMYLWKGEPCKSQLKDQINLQDNLAELEVVRSGDAITIARVTKYNINERIKPGARVKLTKLVPPPAATPPPK